MVDGLVHDQLINGRPFRILTAVDQWSRFSSVLEAGFSMSGQSVAETLERYMAVHGAPISITVDLGTEFTSTAVELHCSISATMRSEGGGEALRKAIIRARFTLDSRQNG